MTDHPSDHLAVYAAEADSPTTVSWLSWIGQVEELLGHDADGDLSTDGYSLDSFYEMWEDGLTPQQAVNITTERGHSA